MTTNWRELRDCSDFQKAFDTFDTFSLGVPKNEGKESGRDSAMVKSAKSHQKPVSNSGDPQAYSVKSAESLDSAHSLAVQGPDRTWPTFTPENYENAERWAIQSADLESCLVYHGISIAIDRETGSALLLFKPSDAEIVCQVADVYQAFHVGELSPEQRKELLGSLYYYDKRLRRRCRGAA